MRLLMMITQVIAILPMYASADSINSFDAQVRDTLLRNPEILLEVFDLLEQQQAEQASSLDQSLIGAHASALFPSDAEPSQVLVEFVDYQCGYCRRAAPEVAALAQANGSIHRHVVQFPILGEASTNAAKVMEAIRLTQSHAVFLEAHDKLMNTETRALHQLRSFVGDLGLDVDQTMLVAASDEVASIINANHALARGMQITGTPGFVTEKAVIRGFADQQTLAALFAPIVE